MSGAGSSPVLGGHELALQQLQLPGVVHSEGGGAAPEAGGTPRPTVATRTADHHQQAWGSEEEVRPGPYTQLRGQAQRWGQTSPQDRKSGRPWWRSG